MEKIKLGDLRIPKADSGVEREALNEAFSKFLSDEKLNIGIRS